MAAAARRFGLGESTGPPVVKQFSRARPCAAGSRAAELRGWAGAGTDSTPFWRRSGISMYGLRDALAAEG